MKETINARVRRYRKELHYSQAYVAEMVGLKTSTYSQMERTGKITCEMLLRLANVLNVSAAVLLLGEDCDKKEETYPKLPKFVNGLCTMEVSHREYKIIDIFRHLSVPKKTLVCDYILEVFHSKSKKSKATKQI
jgi:transcriptional regulator with XRE-family HTH domain